MLTIPTLGLRIYIYILSFLLGTCMASFVSCAAGRYASGVSVLRGRSKCDTCGQTLGVVDLIPIFSYLFLRGKCRRCGAKIPLSCLITELIGGAGYLVIVMKFGLSWLALELILLAPALLAVALIDLRTMEIPNGLLIYMVVLFAATLATYYPAILQRLIDGAIGAAVYGGGLLLISLVMDKILKRDSLGGGDIKLFGAVGLYLGPWRGLLTVLLACLFGLATAGAKALAKKNNSREFPFGPAICLATFVSLLVGSDVIDMYLSLFV